MSVWGYGVFKTIIESRVCTCQEAAIDSVEALIFVCSHKRLVPWTCLFFSYKIVSLFVLGQEAFDGTRHVISIACCARLSLCMSQFFFDFLFFSQDSVRYLNCWC